MNDMWLKALILACTFGAVVLIIESLVRWMANNRVEGKEINLRLKLIAQGHSREETMSLLRRSSSALPGGLPPLFQRWGQKFERTLIAAQVAIPTGRLMFGILIAPLGIFFSILLLMSLLGAPIGLGRIVMVATFSGIAGAFLPLMLLQM